MEMGMNKRDVWSTIKERSPSLASALTLIKAELGTYELVDFTVGGVRVVLESDGRGAGRMPAQQWLDEGVAMRRHHLTPAERKQLDQASDYIRRKSQRVRKRTSVAASDGGHTAHSRNRRARR